MNNSSKSIRERYIDGILQQAIARRATERKGSLGERPNYFNSANASLHLFAFETLFAYSADLSYILTVKKNERDEWLETHSYYFIPHLVEAVENGIFKKEPCLLLLDKIRKLLLSFKVGEDNTIEAENNVLLLEILEAIDSAPIKRALSDIYDYTDVVSIVLNYSINMANQKLHSYRNVAIRLISRILNRVNIEYDKFGKNLAYPGYISTYIHAIIETVYNSPNPKYPLNVSTLKIFGVKPKKATVGSDVFGYLDALVKYYTKTKMAPTDIEEIQKHVIYSEMLVAFQKGEVKEAFLIWLNHPVEFKGLNIGTALRMLLIQILYDLEYEEGAYKLLRKGKFHYDFESEFKKFKLEITKRKSKKFKVLTEDKKAYFLHFIETIQKFIELRKALMSGTSKTIAKEEFEQKREKLVIFVKSKEFGFNQWLINKVETLSY